MAFICSSLRDCFSSSLNPLYYQPFIFLGTLILLLNSPSNKHLSVSFPSDAVSSTFLTFFQVLVENACDVTVVGSCFGCGDIKPCLAATPMCTVQSSEQLDVSLGFPKLKCLNTFLHLQRIMQGSAWRLEVPWFFRCV